jgi:tricorn protease
MMISHNNLHFSLIFSHFYVKIAILSNKNAEKSLFYCTFVTIKNWHAIFAHTDISRIKTNIHTYLFMKKIFLSAALLAASLASFAQQNPLWMRYPAISPDGSTIVFAYKGDIYSVPSQGGEARQLTTNAAFDSYPIWSPDGKKIAFASNREGSMDVYVINANGGAPTRLTTNSGSELPVAFKDNDHVLFSANVMPTAQSNLFASREFSQVYEVSTQGGRPKLYSVLPMENISINAKGQVLYHDCKGYEDKWRKHHTSPITRDIWMLDGGKYQKLTSFKGEDRNPVWAQDGQSFYYLSEQNGSFNIYHRNVGSGKDTQVTHNQKNPIRFLTSSQSGLLCYGYDGEIYTVKEGAEPQKVNISITTDNAEPSLVRQIRSNGATEIALSPSGKEVAFVMHGDVYVTSVDYKTTKRITDTPQQERNVSFSPDGRALVYASERNGVWQIYQAKIKNASDKNFTYCTDIEEEALTHSNLTSQYPAYSPDGKEVAFYEDRATLRILNLKSKDVRTVLDGKYNYSYSDGDIWFEWSPDSKWLLCSYIGTGGWNNTDIALVKADGKEVHDLTDSGYSDSNGKWVLGGKAMLFESDRAGYRSHGSWGAEDDAYLMFFDLDAYDRFRMSKEELELAEANKDVKEKKAEEKEEKKKEDKQKKAEEKGKTEVEKVKPLELDIDNCRDRIVRLTVNSSRMGDAILDSKGEKIYYQAAFEGGYDLWCHDLKENTTTLMMKNIGGGGFVADKDVKNLFLCNGGIKKIDLASKQTKGIDFEAPFNYKPTEERQYLFDHIWRQVKDKFYDPNLQGVDWDGYRKVYERYLPYIDNNFDFAEMLSEMLGELNASHTGCRYYPSGASLQTAALGVFLDPNYEGDGLKIQEIIKRGPFAVKKNEVTPGSIIEKIDGTDIKAGEDYNALLDGKAGKNVRLTIKNAKGKRFDLTIKAISQGAQQELLYKRWVDRNRAIVDSVSGGRIAYVHVKAMNSESFRTVYSELLSDKNRNRDAVIVDERHNGGGWLHDDLCTLLSGKQYQEFVPHGKVVGKDPFNKWTKPSCVLICEDDYSNGHGFPWVYKELGIGKLIGAPVAGTMTAVWWETLMDRSLVFGIPQVGCRDMRGTFGENTQLNPDIEVYNSPEDYITGHDTQLIRAVEEMMKETKK